MNFETDLSIIIVSYNQETCILEALESVKNQIARYGKDISCQLILADDSSEDNTQDLINKWLDINKTLFADIVKIFQPNNIGTCKNFASACRAAKGEHIISIAGDDLFSDNNVIMAAMKCGEHDVIFSVPYKFDGTSIINQREMYVNDMMGALASKREIVSKSKYSCPIINGAVLGRFFFSEEVIEFSEHFDLLDDTARYMRAFEILTDFNCSFSENPFMFYRISSNQVTNVRSKTYSRIVLDKEKLSEYSLKKANNFVIKNAIKMENLRLKNTQLFNKQWKFRYLIAYVDLFRYKIRKKKINILLDRLLNEADIKKANLYINQICEDAKKVKNY